MPPAHHLPGGQSAGTAGTETSIPASAAAAQDTQAHSAAAVPVKLKLKAPKLLIKGSFGHAAEPGAAAAAGSDSATKKHKKQHSAQQSAAPASAGLASPGGGEERKQREADQQQRPGPKHSAPMMAGLITPSVSEQGGGGGAASTAQGGAASGGLATPSSAAPASSAQVRDRPQRLPADRWPGHCQQPQDRACYVVTKHECRIKYWVNPARGCSCAGCGQQTRHGRVGAQDAGPRHREAVQEGPAPHLPASRVG